MELLTGLVSAADAMLDNGFDVGAFLKWQMLAFGALLILLGPSSYYTKNFKQFTSDKSPRGLLAGEGVLMAVREELVNSVSQHEPNGDANWGRQSHCA